MADIRHQALINAASKQIYPLIATRDGLQQWLRPEEGWKIQGDQSLGGKLTFYYGDGHHSMQVISYWKKTGGYVGNAWKARLNGWEQQLIFLVSSQWNSWILFTHRVDFGKTDPLFHTDIGFYVFQLPFLSFVVNWLFAAFIIIFIVTAVAHYLNGGIRVQAPLQRVTPQVKAHLSVLLGILALIKAADYWLQRYELTTSTRGVVEGATYTDVNAQLPAIYLLLLIALLSFFLFIANIWRRGWVLPVLTVGLWAFVAIIAGGIDPTFIQRFQVQPVV